MKKTLNEWKEAETAQGKLIEQMRSKKGLSFAEDIGDDEVPEAARGVMAELCVGVLGLA